MNSNDPGTSFERCKRASYAASQTIINNLTNGTLSRQPHQQWQIEVKERPQAVDQGQIVCRRFAKAESDIQYELVSLNTRGHTSGNSLFKERPNFTSQILIGGAALHGPRFTLHMHQADGQT
ncbi:uncharacterized protein METZ01_LOCUS398863, partial [marine metagenome]